MSADNYNLVKRVGDRWYVWLNLSASCAREDQLAKRDQPERAFLTVSLAVEWADAQGYTEYGTEIEENGARHQTASSQALSDTEVTMTNEEKQKFECDELRRAVENFAAKVAEAVKEDRWNVILPVPEASRLLDELTRLRDDLDFMRNEWTPLSARPCALCVYDNGVFIRSCKLHESDDIRNDALYLALGEALDIAHYEATEPPEPAHRARIAWLREMHFPRIAELRLSRKLKAP
jgi:hypothetical protein